MKKYFFKILIASVAAMLFVNCTKNDNQETIVSGKEFSAGSIIQKGDTLNLKNGSNGRAIKGTLAAGETYYLNSDKGDAIINSGDTLVIQSGVQVLIVGPTTGPTAIGTQDHAPGIMVNGTLLSLGTKEKPILFSVKEAALKSESARDPQSANTDPAYKRYWGGLQGGVASGDIILKWTRLEYLGGLTPSTDPTRAAKPRYGIWFNNPSANLSIEDCWLYGSYDDMIRVSGGKYEIMRNTFEKVGFQAGECVNVKSGGIGDIAFNLVVGGTGNAFKSANAGGLAPQSNMNCYNNTLITTGYRQAKVGEGGSIDFENGGRGWAYNNLMVNCRFGLGILGGGSTVPIADTANIKYGYTYNYGDSLYITKEFLPTGFITKAQSSDINGGNATVPGANNPMFVNYPLPVSKPTDFNIADYVGSFDFHLQSKSPAVGKGYTGFSPYAVVKTDPVFGVTKISQPGKDIGAYQTDGSGNQH